MRLSDSLMGSLRNLPAHYRAKSVSLEFSAE